MGAECDEDGVEKEYRAAVAIRAQLMAWYRPGEFQSLKRARIDVEEVVLGCCGVVVNTKQAGSRWGLGSKE